MLGPFVIVEVTVEFSKSSMMQRGFTIFLERE
jgi:hypothetical protein